MFRCGRKRKQCSACGHRYPKSEYALDECPNCGFARACLQPVKNEGEACRFHGGATPRGVNHPNYQGKGYSRHMPAGMRSKFEDFASDKEQLTLSAEIALARTLLSNTVDNLGGIDTAEAWTNAIRLFEAAISANSRGNKDLFITNMNQLGAVLAEGASEAEKIKSIAGELETVRRLVETQKGIYVAKGEYVQRAQMLLVWDAILDAIGIHVKPLDGGKEAIREVAKVVGQFVN
jgi:predicted  nucleic acid-binding Zn-ribbon protein